MANISIRYLDSFKGLTSNNPEKVFSLTFAIVTSIVIPILLYSIIWFEKFGADNKRTLVNKFTSSGIWCAIEYLLFVQTIDIIRFLYGPLPKHVCFWVRIVKNAIFQQMFLFFDMIILSRYAYIFLLKNPAGFNDDFWATFMDIWVVLFSFLVKASQYITEPNQPLTYYFCCGSDPRLHFQIKTRNHLLTGQIQFNFSICCIFWPANRYLECRLLVEIIFFGVLTFFSITNGKNKGKNKKTVYVLLHWSLLTGPHLWVTNSLNQLGKTVCLQKAKN